MDSLPAAVVSALTAPSRWDDVVSAVADFDREVRACPTAEHVGAAARVVEVLSTPAHASLADGALGTHAVACAAWPPDPDALVAWLLWLQLDFPEAPEVRLAVYAGALGERGLGLYRERAVAKFGALPVIGFGETGRYDRARWALLRIMEELAEFTQDVDLQVLVLEKDLSSGWHYLQVATVLQEAGRSEDAIEWVHRGLAATGGRGAAARLVDLGAAEYVRLGRPAEAAELRRATDPVR
ncbi:hypothetical protein ACFFQW_33655 [Umezawaea endophytica]|uniref:Uncharacterized protein n=1 Tax=Umezawaea endophytica TaxID=1654476 RepID=A0A9X2VQL4_9PSEU|nr:hypothetical protein [Umezawaea endophytica]MCS7480519.1 hypothetical protein [Umezawaea endophytica]